MTNTMDKLTPEQEAKLKKANKDLETNVIFVCETCNKRLTGMKEVREHHTGKQHYTYKRLGGRLNICFA